MVSASAWAAVALLGLAGAEAKVEAGGPTGPKSAPVPSALAKGQYPWYDASNDSVKPVWPNEPEPETNPGPKSSWWKFGSVGELVGYGLAMLALAVLIVVLIELWRRYRPEAADAEALARGHGRALRIEGLPLGVRPDTADPWNEARRLRDRGDYAGAVICLFAHQLLTLERLRMIRLVPGRTGRQLVRAIDQARFRGCVEPTLGLFESVYYGRQAPSAEAFERVWALADEFERQAAAGAAS